MSSAGSHLHLVVIRHAPAEDRATFAQSEQPDAERPLTPRGREKMTLNAQGLREVVPSLDLLATSPYARATQTAAIIARQYGDMRCEPVSVLAPGALREDFLEWLRSHARTGETLALVGHEPDLGELVGWLMTGKPVPLFAFKKGGAACLDLEMPVRPGRAVLRWLLAPAVLRSLAE